MKVPVVLPAVDVHVDEPGTLTIVVDGEPYGTRRTLCRRDLRWVLNEITSERQSAVRVEVHEHDGTTYADIATPPVRTSDDAADVPPAPDPSMPGISGHGFQPGEQVAIACVLLHRTADETGSAVVNLPASVMAGRRASVVLFGLDSHVMARVEVST